MTDVTEDAGPLASSSGSAAASGGTGWASGSTTQGGTSNLASSLSTQLGGAATSGGQTNETNTGGTNSSSGVTTVPDLGGNTATGGHSSTGGTTSVISAGGTTGGRSSTSGMTSVISAGGTPTGGHSSTGGATNLVGVGGTTGAGGTATGGVTGTGGGTACTKSCLGSDAAQCPAQCACLTPDQTVACDTGLSGICAAGKKICTFSSDNTSSRWSACVGASALTRNCSSSNDNNCNGTADNLEAACVECGKASPRACNTHPGYDGVGVCKAGSQTLSVAADNSSCTWSACTGDVAPAQLESCGPKAPDTNCNGVAGDGAGCGIKTIHIYSYTTSQGCSCSTSASITSYYAGDTSPGSGWTLVSTFNVFTGVQPDGTVAVVNQTYGSQKYVAVATSYSASDVVGFVSSSASTNYVRLNVSSLSTGCSGSISQVLLGPTSTGTPSSYYAVPSPK